MITTILFDFMGVVSTEQFKGWKKIADKFGLDPEVIKKRYYTHVQEYGRGGAGSTEKFLENVCGGFKTDIKEFESLYCNWWELNKDMVFLIKKLKKQYNVILFSDNFDASTPSMRADKELNLLFPKMFFSNELGHTKSEKESFQKVLTQLGVNPSECLLIDDQEKPITTAQSLGIESLLFTNYKTLLSEIKRLGILNENTQEFQNLVNKDKYSIFVLACPAHIPFNFAKHSWFVINKKGSLSRWEVKYAKNKKNNSYLYSNAMPPFQGLNTSFFIKKSFWKTELIKYIEGGENSTVKKMIDLIENSEKEYQYCFKYSFLGPNSNTYVQWVLNKFPEFNVKLSWHFIGKEF